MTYSSKIQGPEIEEFAELFEINTGNTYYYYTSWAENIYFNENTYLSKPINRSAFGADEEFRARTVTVQAPMLAPVVQYVANSPIEPIQVKIWRAFVTDLSSFRLIFSGVIKSVEIQDKIVSAACEELTEIFRVKLPRILYQAHCNHSLFDSGCQVVKVTYKVAATVTVSGSNLVSVSFSGFPDGYFVGGHVIASSDIRLITNHVGDTITLQIPFDSRVSTGGSVSAYPGCDKTPQTCDTKFSNLVNFLGMPYIPNRNPVIVGFR